MELDPSMATPTYSSKMDHSKPASLYVVPSDSATVSSTVGIRVTRKGHGCGCGFIRIRAIPRGRGRGCKDAS